MANPWFKFYGGEYLSDPKIGNLTAQERSCWMTLLSLASVSTDPGIIEFLTVETLLKTSGIEFDPYDTAEWDACLAVLDKFERLKMITKKDGLVILPNWEKRQERNLTDAERAKSYRDRKKIRHANVTKRPTNVTLDKNRIDKNRIDIVAESDVPFSLKEEIKKLEENPRRELNIVALYLEHRQPDLQNKQQYSQALKRHLKPAIALKDFSDAQIIKALDHAKKEYKDIYTLETLMKILTK